MIRLLLVLLLVAADPRSLQARQTLYQAGVQAYRAARRQQAQEAERDEGLAR